MDETAHCMHLEENVDLWYLSEIFFSFKKYEYILLHFSLSVKAAPHACVIRTNPSKT